MARIASVNLGSPAVSSFADIGPTGIDKRPTSGPVHVSEPGPRGTGGSGLGGDHVADLRHHGGSDQAVYAYAREDLDAWESALGRLLQGGVFGENLTTEGLDVTGALIGEHWRIGATCLLEVSSPRIPCRTFAGWLGEHNWVQRFNEARAPGAYLRVLEPGPVCAGDAVAVEHRPHHGVSIGLCFEAMTTTRQLLPTLVDAGDALPAAIFAEARRAAARAASGPQEPPGA